MVATDAASVSGDRRPRGVRLIYHPTFRAVLSQIIVAALVVGFLWWIAGNAIENLRRANIASGFGFLRSRAGFDISQSLISYTPDDTYARAFLVGVLNTLLVAVVGIVLATIIGLLLGIARLSRNWLTAKLAAVYVETIRNIPVLLQLLFWYKAVLSVLPGPRQAYQLPFGSSLSNRGLFVPKPVFGPGFNLTVTAFILAIAAALALRLWAKRRQVATGEQFPLMWGSIVLIIGLPAIVFVLTGSPLSFDVPTLKGFNFVGGVDLKPEFTALVLGLSLYTATYIAELVRAGILAVPPGQTEAAYALGLRSGSALRLVVLPQALRIIIPPLTSQYLNLTKNSSLAVAVGYPELVGVFAGTVLNQTGQAVEVIFLTMLVYLAISLATSLLMNWFNRRVALVER